MALTDSQKTKIVRYLGWPAKTLIADTLQYDTRVTKLLDNLNSDIETEIASILSNIAAIDTKLSEARDRFAASSVDGIKINEKERSLLRSERNVFIKELSETLGIPIVKSGMMVGVVV